MQTFAGQPHETVVSFNVLPSYIPRKKSRYNQLSKNHHDPCTHTFDLSEEVDL